MIALDKSSGLTFDALVERYRQPLTRAAYHLCSDREASYDIVQDTLVDAYRGFDGLREPERAGAWLYTILRRKVFAHRRARPAEVALTFEPSAPGPEDAQSAACQIYIEQMSALPDEDREILAGKYLLGLSYRQLGDSLGIKEGAVRVRCFRAKERLRDILSRAGATGPAGGE